MSKSGWHSETTRVKVSSKPRYLWQAVDQDGEVLDFCVTESGDRDTPLMILRRLLRQHPVAEGSADDVLGSKVKARNCFVTGQQHG